MHLWNGVIIVPLLLYNRVIVQGSSYLRNQISSDEKTVFHQFLETEMVRKFLNSRVVTVVGATQDQLDHTMPLLKTLPYFIVEEGKEVCASRELAPDTLVIQFLSNFEKEYITRVMESLYYCKRDRIMLVFEGTTVTERDMELALRSAFEKISKVPIFLNYWRSIMKLYGYGVTEGCTKRVTLILDWVPGLGVERLADWQRNYKHEACPVVVGTLKRAPWMKFANNVDGTVKLIGGYVGHIILAIAEKMNFTFEVKVFKMQQRIPSNEPEGLIASCASGNTTIGVASVRPTAKLANIVDFSMPYVQEYHVWCVPSITKWKLNVISSEFSDIIWMLVGLTFLTSFAVEKIIRSICYCNRGDVRRSGSFMIILNIVGTTLGHTVIYRPLSIGGKVLLLVYLGYSLVITTAYKTSLASLLTLTTGEQSIVTRQGMIDANLTIGGSLFGLEILKDQRDTGNLTPQLIKRYVIESNFEKALLRVSNDRDFAYLAPRTQLSFQTKLFSHAGKRVSFHVLKPYVLGHGQVLVLPRGSRFTGQINRIIQYLIENGLVKHWYEECFNSIASDAVQSSDVINNSELLQVLTQKKFRIIFMIYSLAMVFCILVFFAELVVHKFANKNNHNC